MNCACTIFEDGRIDLCGAHAAEVRRHIANDRKRLAEKLEKKLPGSNGRRAKAIVEAEEL
jgi:hypothetical protein